MLRGLPTPVLVIFGLLTAVAAANDSPPNVLLIVCDDLNTHVSPSGYNAIYTPTLAQLAEEGMTFSRAYCQYPVCGPSRASFLHGLYPESTGVLDNTIDIRQTRPDTVSMPQFFRKNGYWTASVGKVFHSPRHEHGEIAWNEHHRFENDELPLVTVARKRFEQEHGSIDRGGNRRKWRILRKKIAAPLNAQTPPGHGRSGLTEDQHKDGKNGRKVAEWLSTKSFGDKPFFIALGIQKPHVPFLAPDKYFDLYPIDAIRYRRDRADLWDTIPRDAISGRYKAFGFKLGVENDSLRREYIQAYHACISFIDAQIGIVLETLKTQGFWENTIVVFTSDHGYHLGDHFLWGKVTLFDIGTRVPFIVRVPGMTKAESRSDELVELVDVFPTLAQLTGLNAPNHLQGTSLVPLLRDANASGTKEYAYTVVRRRDSLGHALRNQNWRYTQWPGGEELYDLRRDPRERSNLASEPGYAKQLQRFREVLSQKKRKAAAQRSPATNR